MPIWNWRLKRGSRTLSEYRTGLCSGKTLYYEEGIASAFTERFVAAAAALKWAIPVMKRMLSDQWLVLIY